MTLRSLVPINFRKWIDENRHLLKPPVGNRVVWQDAEFIVMVVGGPNGRNDYHVNEGAEFFHQLEGDITLRVLVDGKPQDIPIREGEIFLLPGGVPHSPQRPSNTVGLVLERQRLPHEKDGFLWVCETCGEKLHEEFFHLTDIVRQLPPLFERFWSSDATLCRKCGTRMIKPVQNP
jgi:3-hydroxyanthranilate 3,4-dioxygenase